jgi:hypothetical protein
MKKVCVNVSGLCVEVCLLAMMQTSLKGVQS